MLGPQASQPEPLPGRERSHIVEPDAVMLCSRQASEQFLRERNSILTLRSRKCIMREGDFRGNFGFLGCQLSCKLLKLTAAPTSGSYLMCTEVIQMLSRGIEAGV